MAQLPKKPANDILRRLRPTKSRQKAQVGIQTVLTSDWVLVDEHTGQGSHTKAHYDTTQLAFHVAMSISMIQLTLGDVLAVVV